MQAQPTVMRRQEPWRIASAVVMVGAEAGSWVMSWTELERLVDDVEADGQMQRALRHCRSRRELILAARRLGYCITRLDLQRAWQEEQQEQQAITADEVERLAQDLG